MNHIVGESPGRGGRGISRRTLLRRSVAALGVLAAPYVVTSRAAVSRQVVVRTSGGGYDAARREAVYEAFQKETGIEVVLVAASSAKLVAMAKAGDKGIDVVDTNDNVLLELDRLGALEPMDYKAFRHTDPEDLAPELRRSYCVGHSYFATLLGYSTKAYKPGTEPKSWADFWDVRRFPGPRSMPSAALSEPTLEFALLADGVAIDALYPLDLDRAFAKLRELKPSIVNFWETGAVSAQLLADNEASLMAIWNTRLYEARGKGAPVEAQWNQNQAGLVAFGITKGARNLEAARRFVDFSLSAETQLRWMKNHVAIPANRKALPAVAPQLVDPATNDLWVRSKGFLKNVEWWADNKSLVAERWSTWIVQ